MGLCCFFYLVIIYNLFSKQCRNWRFMNKNKKLKIQELEQISGGYGSHHDHSHDSDPAPDYGPTPPGMCGDRPPWTKCIDLVTPPEPLIRK